MQKATETYDCRPALLALGLLTSAGSGLVRTSLAAEPTNEHRWAVVIGVSKYQNPAINSLNYPAADATAIGEALIDPRMNGLPGDHIKLYTNATATKANIEGSIQNFLKPNVKPGDEVIIFLAGHGVAKGVGADARSYFLPSDVRGVTTQALNDSAVDLRKFSAELAKLPARQFTLFVDACREDPTPGRGVKGNTRSDVLSHDVQIIPDDGADNTQDVSSVTFYACSVGQRAFEDPKFQHGVFTNWILDGIRAGPVPQKPDGAIEMPRLASYVTGKVAEWAKDTSNRGDFEVEQTPEIVIRNKAAAGETTEHVVLMTVKRDYPDQPAPIAPPQLVVTAFPDNAAITVNGKAAGAGSINQTLQQGGDYKITAQAPGYAPVERSVKVVDGAMNQVDLRLEPDTSGGVPSPVGIESPAAGFYQRALDAELHGPIEEAEAGYQATIAGDPKFAAAYERLASLQTRRGRNRDAVSTLSNMVANVPASAHAFSLLSEAYSNLAAKGDGDDNVTAPGGGGVWRVPAKPEEAAPLALQAAQAAVKADPNAAEAQRALGFALVAADQGGKNKGAALGAFGKALFVDDKDATNHYGMGYGIRYFAALDKNVPSRDAELQRSITSLQKALDLRPDYYEAHQQMAYCYHMMNNTDAAMKQYDLANANRGSAADKDEFAGTNVALSGLHQQEAQKSTGAKKQQHEAESAAYLEDAKDVKKDRNIDRALKVLGYVGLSRNLMSFLPGRYSQVLGAIQDPKDAIVRNVQGKINDVTGKIGRGRIPGLGGILGH